MPGTVTYERELAAWMAHDPTLAYRETCDLIDANAFTEAKLRAMYAAIGSLLDVGRVCKLEAIREEMARRKVPLEDGDIPAFYAAMGKRSPREVAEDMRLAYWLRRSEEIIAQARTDLLAAESGEARREVERRASAQVAALTARETLQRARAGSLDPDVVFPPKSSTRALRGPWWEVDDMTGGLAAGDLWTIGAGSGVGKTWWALAYSNGVAGLVQESLGRPARVLYSCVEMKPTRLESRLAMLRAGSTAGEMRARAERGDLDLTVPPDYCVEFVHSGFLRLSDLRAELERARARMDVLVVDFAQIISIDEGRKSRREALDELAYDLKRIAMDYQIGVLALVQLNRAGSQSAYGMPKISHIRESGAFEQASDAVMLLWRPERYVEKAIEDPNERDREMAKVRQMYGEDYAETILGKVREGREGRVRMRFTDSRPWSLPDWGAPMIGMNGLGGRRDLE